MTLYGILDDNGHVVRWVQDKPGAGYDYVVRVISRATPAPTIDWANFEPALF